MEHGGRPQERLRQEQSIFRDRLQGAQEIYYPGRPHGLTATHQDEIDADLLEFLKSVQTVHRAGFKDV
jgi:non-heme chloroperoxidase